MENNDQNLQTIDLGTLKALAYDTLRFVEAYQIKLRAINEQIMKKENEQANMPKAEEKPELECQPEKSNSKKENK